MKRTALLAVIALVSTLAFAQSSFTDNRDGKVYKTIEVSRSIWFAENLSFKTTTGSWAYNDNEENTRTSHF